MNINDYREKSKILIPKLKHSKSIGIIFYEKFNEVKSNTQYLEIINQLMLINKNYNNFKIIPPQSLENKISEIFKENYYLKRVKILSIPSSKLPKPNMTYYSIFLSNDPWN